MTPPDTSKPNKFAPDAEPSYVAQLFVASPKLPLRFYLNAGSMELDMTGRGGSILVPNRHLRDVLRAKGYDVSYREFIGAHDYASWRETLADGLMLLMGSPQTLRNSVCRRPSRLSVRVQRCDGWRSLPRDDGQDNVRLVSGVVQAR